MLCLPEQPDASMLWLAAVAVAASSSAGQHQKTRAPPHSKDAQSRFASLSSTAAKRLPNLLKTLHHPTARMQLLDSVYLGLLKLDIVRHRMQKAKTNLKSVLPHQSLGNAQYSVEHLRFAISLVSGLTLSRHEGCVLAASASR